MKKQGTTLAVAMWSSGADRSPNFQTLSERAAQPTIRTPRKDIFNKLLGDYTTLLARAKKQF